MIQKTTQRYSQALAPEALAALLASCVELGLGCAGAHGGGESPVKVALVHWTKRSNLTSQVVPMPVELIVGLVGIRAGEIHGARRARKHGSHSLQLTTFNQSRLCSAAGACGEL